MNQSLRTETTVTASRRTYLLIHLEGREIAAVGFVVCWRLEEVLPDGRWGVGVLGMRVGE